MVPAKNHTKRRRKSRKRRGRGSDREKTGAEAEAGAKVGAEIEVIDRHKNIHKHLGWLGRSDSF